MTDRLSNICFTYPWYAKCFANQINVVGSTIRAPLVQATDINDIDRFHEEIDAINIQIQRYLCRGDERIFNTPGISEEIRVALINGRRILVAKYNAFEVAFRMKLPVLALLLPRRYCSYQCNISNDVWLILRGGYIITLSPSDIYASSLNDDCIKAIEYVRQKQHKRARRLFHKFGNDFIDCLMRNIKKYMTAINALSVTPLPIPIRSEFLKHVLPGKLT